MSWQGSDSRLKLISGWYLPNPKVIGVATWNAVTDFHSLTLTLDREAEGYQLGNDWKPPLAIVDDTPSAKVVRQCLDFKGKKYLISPKPMSLPDAQLLAASVNRRLLTIASSAEEQFSFEQARGIHLWTSAWRPPSRNQAWRDERNRQLRYNGRWARGGAELGVWKGMDVPIVELATQIPPTRQNATVDGHITDV